MGYINLLKVRDIFGYYWSILRVYSGILRISLKYTWGILWGIFPSMLRGLLKGVLRGTLGVYSRYIPGILRHYWGYFGGILGIY